MWVARGNASESPQRNNRTVLDKEIQQSLENEGIVVTDELVIQVKKLHLTFQRALAYLNGDGLPKDYKKAHELLTEIADVFPVAYVYLGFMARDGLMRAKNPQLALSYFRKALTLSKIKKIECPEAMFHIGKSYYYGEGVPQDFTQAYEWYEKAADLGFDSAEYLLAFQSYYGQGTQKNRVKAFIKWLALAKKGHTDAQRCLGLCYLLGHGTRKNPEQALYWTKLAAESGNTEAETNLGSLYMTDLCGEIDLVKARYWLEKATAQHYVPAIASLAMLLLMENENNPENIKRAIELWQSVIEADEFAIHNLGLLYLHGCRGLTPDYPKALAYLQQSVQKGSLIGYVGYAICLIKIDASEENLHIARDYINKAIDVFGQEKYEFEMSDGETLSLLGFAYLDEEIFDKDISKALHYLEKSAEFGSINAQFALAKLYAEGEDVVQDDEKAIFWYQKAAQAGEIAAQNKLGEFYALGRGAAQDYNQACYWFEQATQRGDAEGVNNLGEMYKNGYGVKQDYERAIQLFEQANAQGNRDSSFNLGNMYFYGHGVAQDYEKAISWYQQALQQNHPKAQEMLAKI